MEPSTPTKPLELKRSEGECEYYGHRCITCVLKEESERMDKVYSSVYNPNLRPYKELSIDGRKHRRAKIRQLQKEKWVFDESTNRLTPPEAQVITEQQPQEKPSEEAKGLPA